MHEIKTANDPQNLYFKIHNFSQRLAKMKQKEIEGAFFKVPLEEGFHTYGRMLLNGVYGFYDFKTREEADIAEIEGTPILFKVVVNLGAIESGAWKIVGVKELSEELKEVVPFFKQEIGHPEICWIYRNGDRTRVDLQECIGLERLSVWDRVHVEKRLVDHYNGVLNIESYASRPHDKWGLPNF